MASTLLVGGNRWERHDMVSCSLTFAKHYGKLQSYENSVQIKAIFFFFFLIFKHGETDSEG